MIEKYLTFIPQFDKTAWIHQSAVVIGNVTLGADVSIWPNVVIRGDVNSINIGERSNIQDGSVIHATQASIYNEAGYATSVGTDVTIGHNVVLHGCQIGNRVLVGMSSTVLDGSVIEDDVMIGAASFVPMNKTLEGGYLYLGSPVKKIRELTAKEKQFLSFSAKHYSELKNNYD